MAEHPLVHRLIVSWSQTLSKILGGASLVAFATIAARVFGGETFRVGSIDVPIDSAWVIFVVATFAHAYVAYALAKSIARYTAVQSLEAQEAARQDVIAEGGLYVRGMARRLPRDGRRYIVLDVADPSVVAAIVGTVASFVAVLPWWVDGRSIILADIQTMQYLVFIGLGLVVANWIVGGIWAIMLSSLGLPNGAEIRAVTVLSLYKVIPVVLSALVLVLMVLSVRQ